MQRGIHVFLICAILPGVILPGQTPLCLCASVDCTECASCCVREEAPEPCCCAKVHRPSCSKESKPARVVIDAKKSCQGCVLLTPHKQTTPKPESSGDLLPHAALPGETFDWAIPATSISREPLRRPTSHAPPAEARSLPLLI